MKTIPTLLGLAVAALTSASALSSETSYPSREQRKPSPGNTTYFVDPAKGDDGNSGLEEGAAWRTFRRVNQLLLAPGDKVHITAPGSFDQTLMIMGAGTAEAPVELSFAPGQYDFHTENLCRKKFQISNTNSDPDGETRVALYLLEAKHVNITGPDGNIVCHGKMIEVCIDHLEGRPLPIPTRHGIGEPVF